MANITLKGNQIETAGELPKVGSVAADFTLVGSDLSEIKLADYKGKKIILNIFPSLDTGICAASVRKFNEELNKLKNTVVLCISRDLPFAHGRFCEAEGLKNVVSASDFRDRNFSDAYGVNIATGPLAGLHSRAIVAIDESGKVSYTEQVPEIVQEPDYSKALAAIS